MPARFQRLLEEQGLDDPDNPGWIVLSREVRLNGRNICRVNGRSVSLQILGEVADLLIDVHGQGEHLSLLKAKTHIHLLDRYAGLDAAAQPDCRTGRRATPGARRAAASAPGRAHDGAAP